MTQYLLGAEVNRIQETLFGAARQRQVVGGSQLMAETGDIVRDSVKAFGGDAIVYTGGNFRIVFEEEEKAVAFGRILATTFHELLNGSMTIAPPVPINNDFKQASRDVATLLAQRKRQVTRLKATPHAPTIAFCQSTGFGLASQRKSLEDSQQYISTPAQHMEVAAFGDKKERNRIESLDDSFLGAIAEHLPGELQHWPWVSDVDEMQSWDPLRSNIAYLVADGNNMGPIFHNLTKDAYKERSLAVDKAIARAIAAPIPDLIDRIIRETGRIDRNDEASKVIPLLPLIRAGDDIFILLPAPYAIDYAQQFCVAFEKEMGKIASLTPPARMGAGVVFCKANYPYNLAHDYGKDALLSSAKKQSKQLGREHNIWLSSVAIGMLVGSEIASKKSPSMPQAYWVFQAGEATPLPAEAAKLSVPIQNLLDQRIQFGTLPNKRRAEVRQLFSEVKNIKTRAHLTRWHNRLAALDSRLYRTDKSGEQANILKRALTALGDQKAIADDVNEGHWLLDIQGDSVSRLVHGMPDLLLMWPYAQSLALPMARYQEEKE